LNGTETDDGKSVALYWDFENLHASLCEEQFGEGAYAKPDARFKPQEPLVDVQAVVELASSFGPIAINRAYCNWQFFGRLDPTFDPKDHGYANFPAMVKALDAVVEVKKGESDQIVRIRA
jgi:hypothetical protein